jgi:hypothetical protein
VEMKFGEPNCHANRSASLDAGKGQFGQKRGVICGTEEERLIDMNFDTGPRNRVDNTTHRLVTPCDSRRCSLIWE